MGISLTALALVSTLEIVMLIYSTINLSLYGNDLWKYRAYYISLLSVAVIYLFLYLYVRKDVNHRYVLLNIANPLCTVFFFGWAMLVTWSDAAKYGVIDSTIFMTFSLTIPLIFYMFPAAYGAITIIADTLMLYMIVAVSGSLASIINTSIFFVFQFVLGISFLRLKKILAERIVEEEDNADIDVMTGFFNRRVYEEDMERLGSEPLLDDLTYISIDLNGLKEINDTCGHEAGDKLIIGAARCIEQCFGEKGKTYRIGGDEFVVLLDSCQGNLEIQLKEFEKIQEEWSGSNDMPLSTAYGYVSCSEFPEKDKTITDFARLSDTRMYKAKARYYEINGRDRRRR
ncbi:MAG: diguanylate cyclase [Eubacterium sp.]|nr:diguanylate cyclase [Eubacterium sp.]